MATIRSIDPTTGVELARYDEDADDVVEHKLAAAAAAVGALAAAGWDQRSAWMRATADLLDAEVESVADMITAEMGKPIAQSRAEVSKSAHTMRFYADNARAFLQGRELDDPAVVSASAARTRFDPLGVVLAVMPWNYPIWQVVRFAAPALMAGNAGILHSLDYGDFDKLVDVFTDDAVRENRRPDGSVHRWVGREGTIDFARRHSHAPETWHKHLVLNSRIQLHGDTAEAQSYMFRFDAGDGERSYVWGLGRYLDTLRREADGKWRIAHRVSEIEDQWPGRFVLQGHD